MSNSLTINTPNIVQQNTPLRNVPSGSTASPDYSVKYVPQDLTEAQQAQARQNIGAISESEIPVSAQADWNETDTESPAYIQNKPTIPAAQVQADWNQSDDTAVDYIKNKPNIGESFDWGELDYSWMFGISGGQQKTIGEDESWYVTEVLSNVNTSVISTVVANNNAVLEYVNGSSFNSFQDAYNNLTGNQYTITTQGILVVCTKLIGNELTNADGVFSNKYQRINVVINNYNAWNRDSISVGDVKRVGFPKLKRDAGQMFWINGFRGGSHDDLAYQARTCICPPGYAFNIGFSNVAAQVVYFEDTQSLYNVSIDNSSVTDVYFACVSGKPISVDAPTAFASSTVQRIWFTRQCYNDIITNDWYHDYQSKFYPYDFIRHNANGSITPIVVPQQS